MSDYLTHLCFILTPAIFSFWLVYTCSDKHRLLRGVASAIITAAIIFGYWWSLFGGGRRV